MLFKSLKSIIYMSLLMSVPGINAQSISRSDSPQTGIEEARVFFDHYLEAYNQRFGKPAQTAAFIESLSTLIHDPFIMLPVNNPPFLLPTRADLTRGFDGFVQQLEAKGAVKLTWQEVNLMPLSEHKILANNVGVATNSQGEVVYETLSLYVLVRVDGAWKIAVFSPYDKAYQWSIE